MSLFEGGNMATQYNVLVGRIDLHFYDYRLTIEIDKNTATEKKQYRKKAIEKELGCKFIDPDKQEFNIFSAVIGIF